MDDARTGTLNIGAGTIQVNSDQTGTLAVTVNGGSVEGFLRNDDNTTLAYRTLGANISFNFTNGMAVGQAQSQGANGLDNGQSANTFSPFTNTAQGAILEIKGAITGSGGLTKQGFDTVVLSGGGANTYTGGTTVQAGTLKIGAANSLPTATDLTTGAAGVFDLNGFNQTVNSINGVTGNGGYITNTATANNTLTTGNNSTNYTYGGVIQGSIALTKTGSDVMTLTGANTYVGPTNVGQGAVIVSHVTGGAVDGIQNTSSLTVANGATFDVLPGATGGVLTLSGATGTTLTLASGSRLGVQVGTTGSSIALTAGALASVTGNITVDAYFSGTSPGANSIIISSPSGGLLNTNGSTANYSVGNLFNVTNFTVNGITATDTLVEFNTTAATPLASAFWKGGLAGNPNVWSASNGTTQSNWTTDLAGLSPTPLVPSAGTAVNISASGDVNQNNMVLGSNMTVASVTINNTDTANAVVVQSTGGNSLTIVNAAAITDNIGASAATFNNLMTLSNAAPTISVASANPLTISGALSGAGTSLTKTGAGTLVLSGANTFTGTVIVSAGVLSVSADNNFGVPANTLSLGGGALQATATFNTARNAALTASSTIDVLSGVTFTENGVISGTTSTGLTKTSPGILVLNAVNTFGGTGLANQEVISGGTIAIGGGATGTVDTGLGTAPSAAVVNSISLSNGGALSALQTLTLSTTRGITLGTGGGTLDAQTGVTMSYGGVIAGSGNALAKTGPGQVTLSGTNTFGGATQANEVNITGGILSVVADANLGTVPTSTEANSVNISNGATLQITGSGVIFSQFRGLTLGTGGGIVEVTGALSDTWAGPISGTSLTKNNSGTLVLSNNTNNYSGGTILNAGILQISNVLQLGVAAGGLTFNGGTLQLNAAGMTLSEGITLNAGGGVIDTQTNNATLSSAISGAGVLSKSGSGVLTITSTNNSASGGLNINAGTVSISSDAQLGTGNTSLGPVVFSGAGTLQYTGTGSISTARPTALNAAGTYDIASGLNVTDSGAFTGIAAGSLTKVSPGTLTLTNAGNTYLGSTTIVGGSIVSGVTNALPATTILTVGTPTTVANTATLNLTNFSQTISGLLATNNSATGVASIIIGPTQTLTVNGPVTLGANSSANDTTNVTFSGNGSLTVNNFAGTFQVGGATGTTNADSALVNMSGLSSFTANMGAGGTFRVGDNNSNGGTGTGASTLTLATNSTIVAGTLGVGDTEAVSIAPSILNLGSGVNVINADIINVATGSGNVGRGNGTIQFLPANLTGTVTIADAEGGSNAVLNMINSSDATGAIMVAVVNLAGHSSNVTLAQLNMAERSGGTASGGTSTFTFDTGTLNVAAVTMSNRSNLETGATMTSTVNIGGGTVTLGTVNMAINSVTSSTTGGSTATLNISGGTVGIASLNMGNNTGATGVYTDNSLVSLTGGTVTMGGDITTSGSTAQNVTTLTLNGAILNMAGHNIGSLALPIGSGTGALNLQAGTLENVAQINGGAAISKTTAGTLIMAGVNTYTGGTAVSAGKLTVSGSLGATAVTVSGGATLSGSGNGATTGIIGNATSVGGGTVTVAGGATAGAQGAIDLRDGAIGTLTIQGNMSGGSFLTLGGAAGQPSVLDFDIGNTTTDMIAVTNGGTLNLQTGGAVININALSGTTLQSGGSPYNLITFAAGSTFTGAFTLGTITGNSGFTYSLQTTSTAEQLVLMANAAPSNAYWVGGVGAVGTAWNSFAAGSNNTNFLNAPAGANTLQLPGSTTNVFFTATSASNLTTTLGQSFAINSLSFTGTGSTAGTSAVAIGGANSLTLNAANSFTDAAANNYPAGTGLVVQSGSAAHTISAPIILGSSQTWINNSTSALTLSGGISDGGAGDSLTTSSNVSGSGAFVLSGLNTYSGGTNVTNGSSLSVTTTGSLSSGSSLVLDSNAASSATFANVGQTLGAVTNGDATANSLNFSAPTGTITMASLTGAGSTNLASNTTITTTFDTGTVTVAGTASIGTVNSGTLNLNGATSAITTLNGGATVNLGSGTALTVNNGTQTALGSITGATGSLTKGGGSGDTLTLAGTNTYKGATNVNAGTMVVSGSISGTSSVTVASGATLNVTANGSVATSGVPLASNLSVLTNGTLSGSGIINGGVDASGTVAPAAGNSSGLTVNGGSVPATQVLTFESSATLQLSLANSQVMGQPLLSDYSKLTLGAGVTANLGGTLVTNSTFPINGTDLFTIIIGGAGNTINGMFSNADTVTAGNAYVFGYGLINYHFNQATWSSSTMDATAFQNNTGGNTVALFAVPEPSSLGMLMASLGVALGLQRFRRRRS